jgi:hypothetical protein
MAVVSGLERLAPGCAALSRDDGGCGDGKPCVCGVADGRVGGVGFEGGAEAVA